VLGVFLYLIQITHPLSPVFPDGSPQVTVYVVELFAVIVFRIPTIVGVAGEAGKLSPIARPRS